MKNKSHLRVILFYIIFIVIIAVLLSRFFLKSESNVIDNYSEVLDYFKKDVVKEFEISNSDIITMTVYTDYDEKAVDADGNTYTKIKEDSPVKKYQHELASFSVFYNDTQEILKTSRNIEVYQYEPAVTWPWWLSLIPLVIIIILIIALFVYSANVTSGRGGRINSFGKAKVKMPNNDKNRVLFRDVAGADEEKEELVEIVEFLRDPAKFSRLGAKIPHGVLLVGPPGTGKTLLAKAVAGEAGVPFFSISGSDFVEMYVGVGASRVRDLFDNARKAPASIIFIDEIDAVGRHRGAGLGGGHDEREQTLNQLLVEMDGFGSHDGIIVIAATNRPDILDPALLRPGRFDRQITVNLPDIKGREEILKVHARNKPLEQTVDFKDVAKMTVGFTGADLANLLNESALLASRRNKQLIGMEDIEDAFMKMILGPKKKSRVRNEHDNKLVAYHEAGHAVASFYCEHTDPVKFISVIPAGNTGGVTVSFPEEDTFGSSKNEMYENIVMSLGGRVAEQLVMEDISTGASGDIQQATKTARNMIMRYGMSDKLGTVLYGSEHSDSEVFLGRDFSSGKTYSEKTAAEIDDEIRILIDSAYKKCTEILSAHIDKLHFIAEFLLKNEVMDGEQFKAAMEGEVTIEDLENMTEAKKRRSREENDEKSRQIEIEKRRIEDERKAAEDEKKRRREEELNNRFPDFDADDSDDSNSGDGNDNNNDTEDQNDGNNNNNDNDNNQ